MRTPIINICDNLYLKLELFNPSGSHKIRAVRHIIETAIDRGEVIPGKTTIIEKTGGNFGYGLITVCKQYGLSIELAVGLGFSKKKRQYLESMGAILIGQDLLEKGWTPKEVIDYHLSHSVRLGKNYFYTDQFNNPSSYFGHLESTGPEIGCQLKMLTPDRHLLFVACAGTGASLMGVRQALIYQGFKVSTCLVEPANTDAKSGVFGDHRFEGMSVGVNPPFLDWDIVDHRYFVTQDEMLDSQRWFAAHHGHLIGNTSAACLHTARAMGKKCPLSVLSIVYDSGLWYDDLVNTTGSDTCMTLIPQSSPRTGDAIQPPGPGSVGDSRPPRIHGSASDSSAC